MLSEYVFLNNLFGGYKGEQSYDEKNYNTGIIRIKNYENNYDYFYVKNKKSISSHDKNRISELKIPSVWNNVWISGNSNSDIQVVGVDSKNRKQYIYNKKHILLAEKNKFLRLFNFMHSIPKLDKVISLHEKLHVYDKNHVISTMLKLIKELHFRVGKEQYAKKNKSYGISSLKKSHLKIIGDTIKFNFKGKSNKRLKYVFHNDVIKKHLQMLLKLEGEKLFQYVDENNIIRRINDTDINQYIQKYMGKEFSAKDFRTYAANYYFVKALLNEIKKHSNNIKKNITNAIKNSARHLSHTKGISKKSYIMSFCINLYLSHPEYFISHKYDNPQNVLMDILRQYHIRMSK
jgi:DNA topoisomerase-1